MTVYSDAGEPSDAGTVYVTATMEGVGEPEEGVAVITEGVTVTIEGAGRPKEGVTVTTEGVAKPDEGVGSCEGDVTVTVTRAGAVGVAVPDWSPDTETGVGRPQDMPGVTVMTPV